jgi:hypothetical protein
MWKSRWVVSAGALATIWLGFVLLFHPWSFHIGGRFTPGESWSGFATKGGGPIRAGLFLDLAYDAPGDSSGGTADLAGTARFCGDGGAAWTARLETEASWWDLDGKRLQLHLTRADGTYPDGTRRFDMIDLPGQWRAGQIALRAGAAPAIRLGEDLLLAYGDEGDFERACRTQ